MEESLLTPENLGENPQLAALRILQASLEVAELSLLAAHPEGAEPSRSETCRSEAEAFALSILYQIDALSSMLEHYAGSVRRSRECCAPEGLPPADLPF